jgi:hypothetical protein
MVRAAPGPVFNLLTTAQNRLSGEKKAHILAGLKEWNRKKALLLILNIVYYHKTADIAHLYWGELTDLYK